MEDIKHTYMIQWVGPLTYDEYKEYVKGTDTIAPSYFNFYYFEARKDARCRWHRYVGIHKQNDGIEKRLNTKHEHFSEFLDCKDLGIKFKQSGLSELKSKINNNLQHCILNRTCQQPFLVQNTKGVLHIDLPRKFFEWQEKGVRFEIKE